MMRANFEMRTRTATLIFDVEDSFARQAGLAGPHPRPIGQTRFFAVARVVGGVSQPLPKPEELKVVSNSDGYQLLFGTPRPLSGGDWVIRVENPFYQVAEIQVTVGVSFSPGAPSPERLAPYAVGLQAGYAYPFPSSSTVARASGPTLLRGAVRAAGGEGVAGVAVSVAGLPAPYVTDSSGQWVLAFPDTTASGNVTVRFAFPGGPAVNIATAIRQGEQTSLPQAALRGQVFRPGLVPAVGATVRVAGKPGQATADNNGAWFYYFNLDQQDETVSVTASLPGGATLTQPAILARERATVVVPSFRFV